MQFTNQAIFSKQFGYITVETDEETPTVIAIISDNNIEIRGGYRIKMGLYENRPDLITLKGV